MLELRTDEVDAVAVTGGDAAASVLDGTRRRILDAGLEVLRSVGHGQFSVQKVARVAGVYQGNVTYSGPRRRDLVLALAVRIVEDYLQAFDERYEDLDVASEDWAETVVRWLMEDAVAEDRVRLMPELWSMANADPEVAREVQRAFQQVTDTVLGRLGLAVGTPEAAIMRRALELVAVSAQGLTAVHGHRPDADDARSGDLRSDLCELLIPVLADAKARAAAMAGI